MGEGNETCLHSSQKLPTTHSLTYRFAQLHRRVAAFSVRQNDKFPRRVNLQKKRRRALSSGLKASGRTGLDPQGGRGRPRARPHRRRRGSGASREPTGRGGEAAYGPSRRAPRSRRAARCAAPAARRRCAAAAPRARRPWRQPPSRAAPESPPVILGNGTAAGRSFLAARQSARRFPMTSRERAEAGGGPRCRLREPEATSGGGGLVGDRGLKWGTRRWWGEKVELWESRQGSFGVLRPPAGLPAAARALPVLGDVRAVA